VQPFFDEVWEGRKTFEVRKDDRDYQAGDTVVLREWPAARRCCWFIIGYVLRGYPAVREDHCVFALLPAPNTTTRPEEAK
jgi:hypothetical protein